MNRPRTPPATLPDLTRGLARPVPMVGYGVEVTGVSSRSAWW
jgi:hypothetical protein